MAKTRLACGRIVCLMLLVLGAFCLGTAFGPSPAVRAGVRQTTSTEHFLAGGERSVPVLEEIAKTLRQIDTRLARIEKVAAAAAGQQDNQ